MYIDAEISRTAVLYLIKHVVRSLPRLVADHSALLEQVRGAARPGHAKLVVELQLREFAEPYKQEGRGEARPLQTCTKQDF